MAHPEGQLLVSGYRLTGSALPLILVVDPITGACLWDKSGFVSADKLMEDLVPYMDHGPTSAGRSGISAAAAVAVA